MQIRTKNLNKVYQEGTTSLTVVSSLSFEFQPGASIAIVGKSGIGKSTLLHMLGGLDHPTDGKVLYGEVDLFSLGPERLSSFRGQNVGFIFQFHHLLPEFDASENIAMPLIISGIGEKEAQERAALMLEKIGLSERRTHRPSQLSGGEQQRVAIARALIAGPKVILADEPTGNLDVRTANEVQRLLLEACKDSQATLIVVTHNLELAQCMDYRFEMQPGGDLIPI